MISQDELNSIEPGDQIKYLGYEYDACPVANIQKGIEFVAEVIAITDATTDEINIILKCPLNKQKSQIFKNFDSLIQDRIKKYYDQKNEIVPEDQNFWFMSKTEKPLQSISEIIKMTHKSPILVEGSSCLECTEYARWAQPNCKNNQFMCYRCRSWNQNKFESLKL